MSSTITLRLPAAQRSALKKRAAALRKTEAALLRELVERELAGVAPAEWVEKWSGIGETHPAVRLPHPLKQRLRERNCRA